MALLISIAKFRIFIPLPYAQTFVLSGSGKARTTSGSVVLIVRSVRRG